MTNNMTATLNESATGAATSSAPRSGQRRSAALVTADDTLWPLVGAVLARDIVLKQIDSIEQLLGDGEPDRGGVVIWDARGEGDSASQLARLRQHLPTAAVMVLDDPAMNSHWKRLADQRLIASMATLPIAGDSFSPALDRAFDEAQMRRGVLGAPDQSAAQGAPPKRSLGSTWGVAAGVAVLAACAAGYFMFGTKSAEPPSASPKAASTNPQPQSSPVATSAIPVSGDEQLDILLQKATQAVLDRRYIEPADTSALTLYRTVLARDPDNAEATQGLARLAQLLLTKAETALEQRHFDAALQSLETARSIIHDDPRVKALDARVQQLRAELGSSVIQATINAGNYDRATSQIDEAGRTKALTADQLTQLREDLRRHRDADTDRLAKLAQARAQQDKAAQESRLAAAQHNQEVQTKAQHQHLVDLFNERMSQGKLTDPENDSAAYYLNSLKAADPQAADLGTLSRTLQDGIAARTKASEVAKTSPSAASSPTSGTVASGTVAVPASVPASDLKLLTPVNPVYPFSARRSGKQGWVDVAFTVGPDGRVSNMHVADASPPGLFDRAALEAMQSARYEAVPRDQPQVNRDAKLRLKFKLE